MHLAGASLSKRVALITLTLGIAAVPPAAAAVPPSNDLVTSAALIPPGPYPVSGLLVPDITDATTTGDPAIPSCTFMGGPVSRSVWYKWTPSAFGLFKVSTAADEGSGSTVDDTVLGIYTAPGDAGPFTERPTAGRVDGCDDDSALTETLQSTLTSEFTGGTTYYIGVWKFDTPAPTAGNTAVQVVIKQYPPVGPEDTAAGAIPLALDDPATTNDSAANDDYHLAAASPCFGPGMTASTAPGVDSVFTFTAPSAGDYSIRASTLNDGAAANLVLYLANAAPSGPFPATVACTAAFNRQTSGSTFSGEVADNVSLTSGQRIFVFVDRAAGPLGSPLHLEVMRSAASETEPNNTPATAGLPACGMRGAVNPATEADFYSLGTPASGARIFALVDAVGAGPSSDVDLRLNNATDTLQYDDASLDTPFGVSAFAPLIAGAMGTGAPLFLQVDRFGASPATTADPYFLYRVLQPASTLATSETEPNNTPGAADAAANNYFRGDLAGSSPSTDADLYRFDVDAGTLIFIALSGDPARDNTLLDAKVELLGPNGDVVLSVNGSGGANIIDNANPPGLFETVPTSVGEGLVWRPVESGAHYVRVVAGSTSATTAAGDYLLSISLECLTGSGPVITTASLPNGSVGTPYNQTLDADNTVGAEQFTISSGTLPPGLALSSAGTLAGTPTVAGTFNFEARVTDARGLRYTRGFTLTIEAIPTPPPPPPPPPPLTPPDTTAPAASRFRVSNKTFAPAGAPNGPSRRGTTFRFDSSEAAQARITIVQLQDGRRVRGKCVRPTKQNAKNPRCTRRVTKGALSFSGTAGANTRAFNGRLGGRKLAAGRYEATLVLTDAARNKSRAVRVTFRVVRR